VPHYPLAAGNVHPADDGGGKQSVVPALTVRSGLVWPARGNLIRICATPHFPAPGFGLWSRKI